MRGCYHPHSILCNVEKTEIQNYIKLVSEKEKIKENQTKIVEKYYFMIASK